MALVGLLAFPWPAASGYPRFVHSQRANVQGLGGAIASVLSPDERYLYVAGFTDDTVSILARDPITGALTFAGSVTDNATGSSLSPLAGKGSVIDGLSSVADLAISPDGEYLYSAGWGDDAIGIFQRLPGGGLLFLDTVTDPTLERLDGVSALELSADGARLWATAYNAASLCLFDRQPTDGSLSLASCDVDPTLLAGARGLALGDGGTRAYVAAMEADTLVWRDLTSLQGLEAIQDSDPGVSGLDGAYAVALSRDEQDVYVASFNDESVVHLRRTLVGHAFVEEHSLGLGAKVGVWVHPSDAVVYATNIDSGINRLFRDPADGRLTGTSYLPFSATGAQSPVGLTGTRSGARLYAAALSGAVVALRLSYADAEWFPEHLQTVGAGGTPYLEGVNEVAWDPSGTHLYVAGDEAIVRLRRHPRFGTVWPSNWAVVTGSPRSSIVVLDGGYVYVANDQSGTVERRNSNLAFQDSLVTSLSSISDLAASPDGRHLYAVSDADEALTVLLRSGPGTLTEIARLDSTTHPTAFDGTSGVAVAADGSHVYTALYGRTAIGNWERDAASGLLTLRSSASSGPTASSAWARVAPSPDGRHVYAVGLSGNDLRVYEHQPNGSLLPIRTYLDGFGGFDGLAEAEDVAVSADGRLVFVAGTGDEAVAVLARDPIDGSLSRLPVLRDDPPVRGLERPRALALSADGSNLYVAASGGLISIGVPNGAVLAFDLTTLFGDGFESGDTAAWSATLP